MRVLKLVCILLMAMLLSAAFMSCSKSDDVVKQVSETESPVTEPPAGNESTIVIGSWSGQYFGTEKSIPVYVSFIIKEKGKLEVFNAEKEQIGSGTWTLTGDHFKAVYTIYTSKTIYFFTGVLYSSPVRLTGAWGYSSNTYNAGDWNMIKEM